MVVGARHGDETKSRLGHRVTPLWLQRTNQTNRERASQAESRRGARLSAAAGVQRGVRPEGCADGNGSMRSRLSAGIEANCAATALHTDPPARWAHGNGTHRQLTADGQLREEQRSTALLWTSFGTASGCQALSSALVDGCTPCPGQRLSSELVMRSCVSSRR